MRSFYYQLMIWYGPYTETYLFYLKTVQEIKKKEYAMNVYENKIVAPKSLKKILLN
jgi:hypothetical protein